MDFFHQTAAAAAAASSDVVQPQLPHQPFQVKPNLFQKATFLLIIIFYLPVVNIEVQNCHGVLFRLVPCI